MIDLYMRWKNNITFGASALCLIALLMSGWYLLLPAVVIGWYTYFIVWQVKRTGISTSDRNYWYPPADIIREVTPKVYELLKAWGYGEQDYSRLINDCIPMERAGRVAMHMHLREKADELGIQKDIPIFPFSFRRVNGKRHRLFFVIDNRGKRHHVDSYPIFDKYHTEDGMFRILTKEEEANGFIVKEA
jgi:hypothetical protein